MLEVVVNHWQRCVTSGRSGIELQTSRTRGKRITIGLYLKNIQNNQTPTSKQSRSEDEHI